MQLKPTIRIEGDSGFGSPFDEDQRMRSLWQPGKEFPVKNSIVLKLKGDYKEHDSEVVGGSLDVKI